MIAKDILARLRSLFPAYALGTEEIHQQTGLSAALLAKAESDPGFAELAEVAEELSDWSWQFNPLAAEACIAIQRCPSGVNTLGSQGAAMFRAIRPHVLDQDRLGNLRHDLAAVVQNPTPQLILRFCMIHFRSPVFGLSALSCIWEMLLKLGRPEIVVEMLDLVPWTEELSPLRIRLLAEFAFIQLSPEDARQAILDVDEVIWPKWKRYVLAETALRMGEKEKAISSLTDMVRTMPWNVNLLLKLHDLLFLPEPDRSLLTSESVHILLYTWNKADLIRDTLDSLEQTDIGSARITVLDNGSSDETPQVLAKARDTFESRLDVVTLPVNIGAPAARNWLAALPSVRECDWAAYLDDDVILPKDWLSQLLTTAVSVRQRSGKIGAVGCRIAGGDFPHPLQSADYNMFSPRFTDKSGTPISDRIGIFDNCAGGFDLGLFSYNRPALSVSGCCHLLSTEALEKAGGFDIRFTPTQFDDLERDMRSTLTGYPNCYAGSLSIEHVQHSSLAKAQTPAQRGHIIANKKKMEDCFSNNDLKAISEINLNMLWDDVLHKQQLISAL